MGITPLRCPVSVCSPQEAAAEVDEDEAEPDSDFEPAVDPDLGGVDSDPVLPLERGSDLPSELGSVGAPDGASPDGAGLLERLSVR